MNREVLQGKGLHPFPRLHEGSQGHLSLGSSPPPCGLAQRGRSLLQVFSNLLCSVDEEHCQKEEWLTKYSLNSSVLGVEFMLMVNMHTYTNKFIQRGQER